MFEIAKVKDVLLNLKSASADNIIDKGHYMATRALLLFLFVLVSSKQIFGDPMSCMLPQEFPEKTWQAFANNYCFITGTFVLESGKEVMPQSEDLPPNEGRIIIDYYQWIPYMLIIQALFFYLPHLLWSEFQKTETDIDFDHLVLKCKRSANLSVDKRKTEVKDVVADLVKSYEHRQANKCASGFGHMGTLVYIFSKVLNIVNVLLQICVLNFFLGELGAPSGFKAIGNALKGISWTESGLFPRMSFCHFKHNVLGNIQSRTVQCVLMANMVYEQIFLILYLWFFALLVLSVIDVLYTLLRNVSSLGNRRAADRYLTAHPNRKRIDSNKFASLQLGHDGLLLLHFIENNGGFAIASEVAFRFYNSLRGHAIRFTVGADKIPEDVQVKKLDLVKERCIVDGSLAKDIDDSFAESSKGEDNSIETQQSD